MALKLYNTLKRKTQVFKPAEDIVKIYTCGPTVYNYPHLGNYRAYLAADILKKYLKYKGYKVKHVTNITDVDDKTIRDSQKEGVSLKDFTEKYTKAFFEDLDTLRIEKADVYPRATETIPEMIKITKELMQKKLAYKGEDNSIYYNVAKFKKYGKLANIDITKLQSGASGRVKADEYTKENVQDFALWKAWDASDGEVFWETELGKGRPGWHIECSAMSMKFLGEQFDIHTGGVDLIFPHHQNEIAQSEGVTKKQFVKYWIHNEWLLVNGEKMSKSKGNFYTLRDILSKGYSPLATRYSLISTQYRQQLNFTLEGLDASKNSLQRLWDFIRTLKDAHAEKDNAKTDKIIERARKKFEKAMDNDIDISPALAAIFDLVRDINTLLSKNKLSSNDANKVREFMLSIDKILGVLETSEEKLSQELQNLIDEREKARQIKNWARSDEIRDELKQKGIILEDTPRGMRWKRI